MLFQSKIWQVPSRLPNCNPKFHQSIFCTTDLSSWLKTMFLPKRISNPFWWPPIAVLAGCPTPQTVAGGSGSTDGKVQLTPAWLPRPMTLSHLAISLQGTGAGDLMRLCIYNDNGFTPQGGKLLLDSGSITPTGPTSANIPNVVQLSSPIRLGKGIFWLGWMSRNTSTSLLAQTSSFQPLFNDTGNEMMTGCHYIPSDGFGSFIDPCPTVIRDDFGTVAVIMMRIKSIDG